MKPIFALALMMAIITPRIALAADEVKHLKYSCDDGKILDVVYIGNHAVMLQMDELIPMKSSVTGSGVRYVPVSKYYAYELWGKGNDMNLSIKNGGKEETILSNCKP